MAIFKSFVFEEDEIAAHNLKVLRDRPLLISYIIIALGFLIALGTKFITLGILLLVVGIIFQLMARFSIFTPKIRTGNLSKALTIADDYIQIENTVFDFSKVQSVHIKMFYLKGQTETDLQKYWKSDGTNNEIIITHNNIELKFKYLLPSYKHVLALRTMNFPVNVTMDDRVK